MQETETTIPFSFASATSVMSGKKYREVIGRRKTATARVRVLLDKKMSITVNDKTLAEYFPVEMYKHVVMSPLVAIAITEGLAFTVVVNGGGQSSQADAVRHGISRALTLLDPNSRGVLKRAGYLKRDPRSKERKKPGLKKARKSAQWSKR